ncbi:MAG: hypothetical protein KDD82_19515 [Planctomycetes bacterium]|nr:hypothetical protein [Planctomycetota bacterium]
MPAGLGVVEFPARQDAAARRVEGIFARCADAVQRRLGRGLARPARVVLCDTEVAFAKRFREVAGGAPPDYALAIAFADRDLILVRTARLQPGTWSDLESTLSHELAHLVLGDVERARGRRLPRWLNEGLAEFASGRALLPRERSALAGQARLGAIPSFAEWAEAFPQHGEATGRAYTTTCAFVGWVDAEGIDGVPGLVQRLRGATVDEAFTGALGWTAAEAEDAWLEQLAVEHSWWSSILHSLNLWGVVTLIALAAFVRQGLRTRRLRRELIRQDEREDARRAARLAVAQGEAEHDQPEADHVAEEGLAGHIEVQEHEHQARERDQEHGGAPQNVLPEALAEQPDPASAAQQQTDQDQH